MYFYTRDLNPNPTRVEPGLDAGFIFHLRVHVKLETKLKPEKNPKKTPKPEKKLETRKKPKKIRKKRIYKTRRAPEPDPKPDGFGFGCQISPAGSGVKFNPTIFFHGSVFWLT
jgi:outer membrane biosynthesis protein TonB